MRVSRFPFSIRMRRRLFPIPMRPLSGPARFFPQPSKIRCLCYSINYGRHCGSLYDRLERFEEIARCYVSLEEFLRQEKQHGDRLEQEKNHICEVRVQLRGYVM